MTGQHGKLLHVASQHMQPQLDPPSALGVQPLAQLQAWVPQAATAMSGGKGHEKARIQSRQWAERTIVMQRLNTFFRL